MGRAACRLRARDSRPGFQALTGCRRAVAAFIRTRTGRTVSTGGAPSSLNQSGGVTAGRPAVGRSTAAGTPAGRKPATSRRGRLGARLALRRSRATRGPRPQGAFDRIPYCPAGPTSPRGARSPGDIRGARSGSWRNPTALRGSRAAQVRNLWIAGPGLRTLSPVEHSSAEGDGARTQKRREDAVLGWNAKRFDPDFRAAILGVEETERHVIGGVVHRSAVRVRQGAGEAEHARHAGRGARGDHASRDSGASEKTHRSNDPPAANPFAKFRSAQSRARREMKVACMLSIKNHSEVGLGLNNFSN